MGKNMENIKISVIIPIYNTEKYLEETLDSILNQTMINDIEVLMIDDGSCDNSRYIVEKYALDYTNFFSFHHENMGSGQERNFGIRKARGEYVHFMDSDDYIVPTFYEELYNLAKKEDYDFVIGNSTKFTKNSNWKEILYKTIFKNTGKISSSNIKNRPSLVYNVICWDKLIKREYLLNNSIFFPNKNITSQDMPFSLKLHYMTNSIGMINKDMYYWRTRQDDSSVTQQKNKLKSFNDRMYAFSLMMAYINEMNVEDEIKNYLYFKWLDHDLIMYLKRINNYSNEDQKILLKKTNDLLKIIPDEIKSRLSSYKRILYKMVETKDESLFEFAELIEDIKSKPHLIYSINEKYKNLINFRKDVENEEIIANLEDIEINEKNKSLEISIETYIPYLINKTQSNIKIKIFKALSDRECSEHELINSLKDLNEREINYIFKGNEENIYKIAIPYEELKNLKGRFIFLISYENEDIKKEGLLKLKKSKKTLELEDIELFSKFWLYRIFNLDINKKRKENIKIIDIEPVTLQENNLIPEHNKEFKITLESVEKIDSLIIENLVTLKQCKYCTKHVHYEKDKNFFEVNIPFKDLLIYPLRKWELKTDSNIRVNIDETYRYKNDKIKINFKNNADRLFIQAEYYNKLNEIKNLEEYNKKLQIRNKKLHEKNKEIHQLNKNLNKDNKKLNLKNKRLNQRVEEFQSRKIIRFVDKIQNFKKKL